ncbi:MAG: glucose 1-dehydrogenase [Burkholderiales bacterium]|nr:glucose 1-dehydrogenase [Burkholderiales bacterium]
MGTLESFLLTGKGAIVTGAGGGIGRAICRAYAEAGAAVACVDFDAAAAAATAAEITGAGGRALAIACDVASDSATRAAVERAAAEFGALHVLVNGAAGSDPSGSVLDYDLAAWNAVFATNVGGAFLMSKWAIPHIARAGGGSVIHIASQMGSVGAPGRVAYCASKGALIQMAKVMAMDHAAQNIRVNTLSPGAVETARMLLRTATMDEARARFGPKHVLGRLGLPRELAPAALFLASDASSFMTGADLLVDGGYNAW